MEHDSLADFLSISGKIGNNENSCVKGILTTNQRRKECERKALAIVQLFLERSVSVDLFLKSIAYLNPSYYEDISEERAILLFCGYPLCRKRISKPKYRYKIANKSKQVYDLNEYGNFCSVFCFNANNHIKAQILDSPLWLRDLEDIPKFSLLKKSETQHISGGIDIKSKKVVKTEDFTTVSSFAKLSLDDVSDINFSVSALEEKGEVAAKPSKNKDCKPKLPTVMEHVVEELEEKNNQSGKKVLSNSANELSEDKFISPKVLANKLDNNLKKPNNMQKINETSTCSDRITNKNKRITNMRDLKSITDRIKSKVQKSTITIIDPLPLDNKRGNPGELNEKQAENENSIKKKKSLIELKFLNKDAINIENILLKVFREWITLETLIFIHGDYKIKEILDENKLSEHFEKLRVHHLEIDQQQKYVSICRRLLEQEVFEEKLETLFVKNNLRPLPDYKQLKSESKEFDLKVRTFLSGQIHESNDKNFGPLVTDRIENSCEEPVFLPLADNDSQNALRQKILSNTLDKVIGFLLDFIHYDSLHILTNLKDLIRTFNLTADNIVFKPVIGNYIGFICLKILSLKDDELCKHLQSEEFEELESSIFEKFSNKTGIITSILELINHVDKFVESYVSESDSTQSKS